jgi:hypothetical protein
MIDNEDELKDASIRQAFEWVKTGKWKLATFTNWCKAKDEVGRMEAFEDGYDSGYACGLSDEKIH